MQIGQAVRDKGVPRPPEHAAVALRDVLVQEHRGARLADAGQDLQHAAEVADVEDRHLQLDEP